MIDFYPFDIKKYNNIGASSLYIKDWKTHRIPGTQDYNIGMVQKKIKVESIPLKKYCEKNNIQQIDLLCMDVQGAELEVIKSLDDKIVNVNYIILEATLNPDYKGGTYFYEIDEYLNKHDFKYICSDKYHKTMPPKKYKGLLELNALYKNKNIN